MQRRLCCLSDLSFRNTLQIHPARKQSRDGIEQDRKKEKKKNEGPTFKINEYVNGNGKQNLRNRGWAEQYNLLCIMVFQEGQHIPRNQSSFLVSPLQRTLWRREWKGESEENAL